MRAFSHGVDPERLSHAAHWYTNSTHSGALELQVLNRWFPDCEPYGEPWTVQSAFALMHFACTTADPWDPTCARQLDPNITPAQHQAFGAAMLARWVADPTDGGCLPCLPPLASAYPAQ